MSALDRLVAPFARARSRDSGLPTALVLLSGAIAAAVLSPIAWILLRVLEAEGGPSLLTHPSTFATSIALVAVVTGASVVLGVPLAFLTVRTDLPFRRFWTIAVALPLVIPSYLGAFTYISAFGPSGYIADLLAPLGVDSVPSVYGFGGVALVLTLYTFPYVFITTRASLLSFDESLVEAARTLGVSRIEAFRRVTLPQLVPGIASGALLVALYALSDFGTPNLLRLEVLTQAIWVEFNGFGRETAAMLSLQLLTITAVILALQSRVGDSTQGAYVGTRASTSDTTVALGRWKAPALAFCASVVTMCLVVPLGVLFVWFRRGSSAIGRTRLVFEWSYASNSVLVSVAAAVACALAAIPVAYLAARHRSTVAELIDRATYIGYAMPGIVLGLALVFFGVSYGAAVDDLSSVIGAASYLPTLYQTLPLLIFAYVVRFLPQSVGATRSSVMRVDRELTEAARLLGESPLGAFRRVALPLIAPGVFAGAALVFLTTMKELPATLLLQPTGFDTLVTYIWAVRESGSYGAAAIPAFVLIVVSALSMVVILSQEK
ncbi:iron(III) transport system permease protein [Halarchaeum rubridurum]|uniref:Iron ABC transporter permease n=1 Tax=Halarchaeum rubridurum TaxID=489911 RepID=A0A830FM40_9EURY|nr:iron ABC transporter permease [Halarchaeum rubridurum]MBP1954386.1 iron(III) transport system permease protein [Halarchaeum rubridurum]GGM60583.1 iron ABC transporter permease [Halarchaeum rubridurum]